MRVKICGLTRSEDVSDAVGYGADAVGFIFGYRASARNRTFEQLKKLTRKVPPFVSVVVVSPSSNPDLPKVVKEIRPSFLQLSSNSGRAIGSSSPEKTNKIADAANIIETVHLTIGNIQSQTSIISECKKFSKFSRGILLDSALVKPKNQGVDGNISDKFGGTGLTHDWELSRQVRNALDPFPIILAGGLTEHNVLEAIRTVQPFAVDVSSGVESKPGIKDKVKMKNFIQNAKTG